MRLPFSDRRGAFPELDSFTPEQRERLAERARVHAAYSPGGGCVLVFFISAVVLVVLALLLSMAVDGTSLARAAGLDGALGDDALPALAAMAGVVAAIVFALWFRDHTERAILRQQVARTTCPSCRASLLGATRSADSARCGSCGVVLAFATLEIQSEDLGPPLFALGPDAKCPKCTYVVAGLLVLDGIITCPECGEKTAVVVDGPPPEVAR